MPPKADLLTQVRRLYECVATATNLLPRVAHSLAPSMGQRLVRFLLPPVRTLRELDFDAHASLAEGLVELEEIVNDLPCSVAPIIQRGIVWHFHFPGGHSLSATEWQRYLGSVLIPLWKQHSTFALLCSLSRDGYVRQAALRSATAPLSSPLLVHILLYRLLDWVPAVREEARACLQRITKITDHAIMAEGFLGALATLPRRSAWRETGPSLIEHFNGAGIFGVAVDQLAARQQGPSGVLLRRLIISPEIDAHLPALARTAKQPAVRAVALRCLLSGVAYYTVGLRRQWVDKTMGRYMLVPDMVERPLTIIPAPRRELIQQAIFDRAACVRRIALDAAIREPVLIIPVDQLRSLAMMDKAASVRSRASWLLRQPLYSSIG